METEVIPTQETMTLIDELPDQTTTLKGTGHPGLGKGLQVGQIGGTNELGVTNSGRKTTNCSPLILGVEKKNPAAKPRKFPGTEEQLEGPAPVDFPSILTTLLMTNLKSRMRMSISKSRKGRRSTGSAWSTTKVLETGKWKAN